MKSKNLDYITGSASISLMQKANELKEAGISVIDLAGGEPDFDTPTVVREEAVNAIRAGHTHYTVGKGIKALRTAIADKVYKDNGIVCDSEQIIVTPGGKYGIYLAVSAIVNPGDEVIILAPYWVSYEPIVRLCGGVPVIVELDFHNDYKIEKDAIMSAVTNKTKLLIINYPNNPTGRILHSEEADILKEIVLKTGIYVISDEIYEKIVYDNKQSISLASDARIADNVITINGFSKSAAMTGWRLGYTIASKSLTEAMYKIFQHTITGTSTFIQEAAVKVFECEEEIEEMRSEYERRRDYIVNEINKIPKLKCANPEGTFYLWIYVDTRKSAKEICEYLLNSIHLVAVPGTAYGEKKGVFMRICFAHDLSKLEAAVDKLRTLVL